MLYKKNSSTTSNTYSVLSNGISSNKTSDSSVSSEHPINNQYIPSTYKSKRTYNALLNSNLRNLNSAVTMAAEDCEHIANFVDGLVENDEYGRITKALASKVEVNASRTEYTFTIKDNIKWMTSAGEQYVATVEGRRVEQTVTAEDFVASAKMALDFRNHSDNYYLPAMFLKGGYEYWAYTYAVHLRDTNTAADIGFTSAHISTDVGLAAAIN